MDGPFIFVTDDAMCTMCTVHGVGCVVDKYQQSPRVFKCYSAIPRSAPYTNLIYIFILDDLGAEKRLRPLKMHRPGYNKSLSL